MNLTIDQFLSFFNGIYCDFDGADGDQCFDLANNYSRWIGGKSFTGATADLIYQQIQNGFYIQIANGTDNFPQKGDIVVFDWPHVGIATGNNTNQNQLELLEQNDPLNSNCHIKLYINYNGVIGWLRPKTLPSDNSADLKACLQQHDQLVILCNEKDNEISQLKITQDNLNQQINDRNNNITTLNGQISSLTTQLISLEQEVSTLKPIAAKVPQIQKLFDQSESDRSVCLKAADEQQALIKNLRNEVLKKKPTGFWNKLEFLLS